MGKSHFFDGQIDVFVRGVRTKPYIEYMFYFIVSKWGLSDISVALIPSFHITSIIPINLLGNIPYS